MSYIITESIQIYCIHEWGAVELGIRTNIGKHNLIYHSRVNTTLLQPWMRGNIVNTSLLQPSLLHLRLRITTNCIPLLIFEIKSIPWYLAGKVQAILWKCHTIMKVASLLNHYENYTLFFVFMNGTKSECLFVYLYLG